ncbi:hypothetical protein TNCV_332441 [Trichonephila clavipes]|nr:hypothetical protein TNCV_332441 [Trichonephila clavipes]
MTTKLHPKTFQTQEAIKKLKSLILKENRLTQRFIASRLGMYSGTVSATETSRNITARDISGEIHYLLDDSRGFRTRQLGRRIGHQLCRQKLCQLDSTAKISPSYH